MTFGITLAADEEARLKTAFAIASLRERDDPFKAAMSVMPDPGLAIFAAQNWPNDTFVCAEKMRLIEEKGETSFLPSKADQLKDIWIMCTNPKLDEEIRLKAHRLYAEIMGNIEKNPTAQLSLVNNGIIMIPVPASMDDWEKTAKQQQRGLVLDAS